MKQAIKIALYIKTTWPFQLKVWSYMYISGGLGFWQGALTLSNPSHGCALDSKIMLYFLPNNTSWSSDITSMIFGFRSCRLSSWSLYLFCCRDDDLLLLFLDPLEPASQYCNKMAQISAVEITARRNWLDGFILWWFGGGRWWLW